MIALSFKTGGFAVTEGTLVRHVHLDSMARHDRPRLLATRHLPQLGCGVLAGADQVATVAAPGDLIDGPDLAGGEEVGGGGVGWWGKARKKAGAGDLVDSPESRGVGDEGVV